MWKPIQVASALVAMLACVVSTPASAQSTPTLTVTESEGGGPTPETLVDDIVDPGSNYTLVSGSVSRDINTTSGSFTSSLRAMGEFENGTVPPGTFLPTNQPDPQNPTATYAGGIGVGVEEMNVSAKKAAVFRIFHTRKVETGHKG